MLIHFQPISSALHVCCVSICVPRDKAHLLWVCMSANKALWLVNWLNFGKQKGKKKETFFSLTKATKLIRYSGINLLRNVKNLDDKSNQPLLKGITNQTKKTLIKQRQIQCPQMGRTDVQKMFFLPSMQSHTNFQQDSFSMELWEADFKNVCEKGNV